VATAIESVWNSSALTPCNATASAAAMSGYRQALWRALRNVSFDGEWCDVMQCDAM
jgi:hypothetical protein